jgi:NADPH-dependent 7-cyano-7-deazaguanine reductase QueF
MQWRNEGIFGEAITGLIASDLFEVLDAHWVEVKTTQQARGGLVMTSIASRSKGLDKEYSIG